jgi:hypothetical protein
MRDLYNNSTAKALIAAGRKGATGTTTVETGDSVDLAGEGRKCLVVVSVGETATATLRVTIQESTDDSTWTTLETLDYETTGLEVVDLTPTKRYIRAVATASETDVISSVYTDFGVTGIIYDERFRPSNVS